MQEGYCRVAYYRSDNGLWTGRSYEGPEEDCAANTPAGSVAMPYEKHPETKQMVDGALVDYQPPPPEPASDYEWDSDNAVWKLTPAAQQIESKDRAARMQISELEYRQGRAVRENSLQNDQASRNRLQAIEDEIALLRQDLKPENNPETRRKQAVDELLKTIDRLGIRIGNDRLRGHS